MKSETSRNNRPTVALSPKTLEKLKEDGFRYVRVNAFSHDKRLDYMEPYYFVLMPVKDLTDDPDKKGIYEPINSQLLMQWANFPNEGIKVVVQMV